MTEIGSDIRVLQPCSFPRGRRRWEINTRLATPAQERQRICHRTGMPRFLVISGIWVNQEEGWITKQSKNQTGAQNTLLTYIQLTVLSSITWVQDCGWRTRDKLLYQGGPFVEFAHEDLIEIET